MAIIPLTIKSTIAELNDNFTIFFWAIPQFNDAQGELMSTATTKAKAMIDIVYYVPLYIYPLPIYD